MKRGFERDDGRTRHALVKFVDWIRERVARWRRKQARSVGAASNPRVEFKPNPPGTPERSLAEAIAMARAEGVEFDDEEIAFVFSTKPLGVGLYASYLHLYDVSKTLNVEVSKMKLKDGRVKVQLCPSIRRSDEKLIGTIAHEVYELQQLLQEFESRRGAMDARTLHSLVNAETGTIHLAAWEYAEGIIAARRRRLGG